MTDVFAAGACLLQSIARPPIQGAAGAGEEAGFECDEAAASGHTHWTIISLPSCFMILVLLNNSFCVVFVTIRYRSE